MERPYQELGMMIRRLRTDRHLSQRQVLDAVVQDFVTCDDRTLRRYESGALRPPKKLLLALLSRAFEVTDSVTVSRILRMAGYALTPGDIRQHGLSVHQPEPQETLWGPNNNMPPGICIMSSATSEFIPWVELKPEIESMLLNQLGGHIPPNCTAGLGDYKGRPNWLTLIIDSTGKQVGEVWYGTDADNNWRYDGLVRVGDDTYVVWQVFQRYSDGSYLRIRKQAPRAAAKIEG